MTTGQFPGVPGVAQALWSLGVKDYILKGNPSTEDEFKSKFRKFDGDTEITDSTKWGVTWTQVKDEKDKLLADYNAKKYQRDRLNKYPSLEDFADAMYWNSKGDDTNLKAYYAACEKVKTDYPKS